MKTLLIALAGILTFAPMATAKQRLEPAQVIVVRPHYRHVPAYSYYWPQYYTYYGPRYYTEVPATTLYPDSRMGEVEIKTHFKDAMVYIDGGFAGDLHKLDLRRMSAMPSTDAEEGIDENVQHAASIRSKRRAYLTVQAADDPGRGCKND
jgi:hypothetical protein